MKPILYAYLSASANDFNPYIFADDLEGILGVTVERGNYQQTGYATGTKSGYTVLQGDGIKHFKQNYPDQFTLIFADITIEDAISDRIVNEE